MKDDISEDFDAWVTKKETETQKKFKDMDGDEKLAFLKEMLSANHSVFAKLRSDRLSDETIKGNQIRANKIGKKDII